MGILLEQTCGRHRRALHHPRHVGAPFYTMWFTLESCNHRWLPHQMLPPPLRRQPRPCRRHPPAPTPPPSPSACFARCPRPLKPAAPAALGGAPPTRPCSAPTRPGTRCAPAPPGARAHALCPPLPPRRRGRQRWTSRCAAARLASSWRVRCSCGVRELGGSRPAGG